MSNFRKIFYFFFQYWNIVQKRGINYSGLAVTITTSFFFFDILRIEWENNGWDIEELKYLCLAIDASCEELNLHKYVYCQVAYLDNIRNYYIQNKINRNVGIFTI